MLNDKEIEIINKLKSVVDLYKNSDNELDKILFIENQDVLNLIVKLQNEIKNSVSKDIIRDKINERQFELQQEYEDFEGDIRLETLQELYYM